MTVAVPGRGTSGARVVDVHAHLVPLNPASLDGIDGVRVLDNSRLEIDGHRLDIERLYHPEKLVQWMDANGIVTALVSAPPPVYRPQLKSAQAEPWTAYLNDGLAMMAGAFPGRLQVLAHLPLEHPGIAAREVESRCGEIYAGFSLPAGGAPTIRYAGPELTPVWEALNSRGSFAFLHPGVCTDPRLDAFYAHNLVGNPCETAIAASELVFGGVVEDYPAIRFCLAHCGGAVPALAGRWQQGYDTDRPGIDRSRAPPREMLKRFWVDSLAYDHDLVELAAKVFGADRILLGSDWPFPIGIANPREWLSVLPENLQRNILSRNFAALMERASGAEA